MNAPAFLVLTQIEPKVVICMLISICLKKTAFFAIIKDEYFISIIEER